ncbi:outer membrane beta-barrel protein [Neolewinella antarctica]|uniref:Outer membrane protein beta-barrel domain-containing protein n=1 Tax=Neolewinella antarctica TaxID=442734 RepID=A0ABX0X7W3_9BACT|nr:outer membrane beta-barrel protein [Neolewinella antarctica]NJC25108.1 hypothetical protein [Neolewinella antarctica]
MSLRHLITTFLCLLLAVPAAAQTFRASVLGGANLSQVDGDMLFGFNRIGANAGLRVVAVLSERWRVGPEILLSQQGARQTKDSFNISPFQRINFSTLEVPLMVYYKDWRITAEAGVSYQRVIDSEIINGRGVDITADNPFNENLFAIKFGVTLYVTKNLGVNFRWSKHLANIAEFDPRLSEITTFRGRTISLRAVYTFGQGEILPQRPVTE